MIALGREVCGVGLKRRDLGSPVVPGDVRDSPLVRILTAVIDEAASEAHGWVETVEMREQDRAAHRLSAAARYLPNSVAPEVLAAFDSPDCVQLIIGSYEADGKGDVTWTRGLSDLTPQETRAWDLKMRGFGIAEIARSMDGRRRRTMGMGGLSIATTERHIENGRVKLKRALGLAVN